jgi:hypothetical protein
MSFIPTGGKAIVKASVISAAAFADSVVRPPTPFVWPFTSCAMTNCI